MGWRRVFEGREGSDRRGMAGHGKENALQLLLPVADTLQHPLMANTTEPATVLPPLLRSGPYIPVPRGLLAMHPVLFRPPAKTPKHPPLSTAAPPPPPLLH